ncbi:Lrp/AsnC family transcriptional regulator [Amycolatopsis pigmentata]|uniref:Lrp/AsnC family transcriptional regulator n=1 Tax=Amycolatopsis pigmentata TaxID=450801 RepID=A0ABW5FZS8_9PSEU
MTGEGNLDEVDLDLIAALQHAPRAPFDLLARTLGSSARTVARRYGRLVEDGLMSVICELDWSLLAEGVPVNVWIRTEPGQAQAVAEALVDRSDTTYVAICSGRGDVYAVLHGMTRDATTRALVVELPGISGVRGLRTEWVLRRLTSSAAWRLKRLSRAQEESLVTQTNVVDETGTHQFGALERKIAALLREDARLPYADIARSLDITESRARRTATDMFSTGLLRPRVEVEPRELGFQIEAVLSISCHPNATSRLGAALASHPATRFLGITGSSAMLTYDGVFHSEGELADFLTGGFDRDNDITAVECSLQLEILKRYWTARSPRGPSGGRSERVQDRRHSP